MTITPTFSMKLPRDKFGLAHLDHRLTTGLSLSILCFSDRGQPKHVCVLIRIHGMCRVVGGPVRGERQLKARVQKHLESSGNKLQLTVTTGVKGVSVSHCSLVLVPSYIFYLRCTLSVF